MAKAYMDLLRAKQAAESLPVMDRVAAYVTEMAKKVSADMMELPNSDSEDALQDLLVALDVVKDKVRRERGEFEILAKLAGADADSAKIKELTSQVAALASKVEELTMSLTQVQVDRDAALAAVQDLRTALADKDAANEAAIKAAVATAERKVADLTAALAVAGGPDDEFRAEIDALNGTVAALKSEIEKITAEQKPQPAPTPDPVPAPMPDPVPEPAPVPEPTPVPEPQPEPTPEPTPEPAPEPVPVEPPVEPAPVEDPAIPTPPVDPV